MADPDIVDHAVVLPDGQADEIDPKGPIILAGSVQGSVGLKGAANGEIPAVVSITRVPGKPQQTAGLKIRTDLGVARAGGPPPLLRVGGPGRPQALPPMPRLRLGGVRGSAPPPPPRHHPPPPPPHPLTSMMSMVSPGIPITEMGPMHHHHHPGPMLGHRMMGMPVIANSMSLRPIRPRPPFGQPASRAPQQPLPTRPKAKFGSSAPAAARPAQVRTVFVPPPMKVKSVSPLNGQATAIQAVRNEAMTNGGAEAARPAAAAAPAKLTRGIPLPIPIKKEMTDEEALLVGRKYRNKTALAENGISDKLKEKSDEDRPAAQKEQPEEKKKEEEETAANEEQEEKEKVDEEEAVGAEAVAEQPPQASADLPVEQQEPDDKSVDFSDDGVDENDDEYNEITEIEDTPTPVDGQEESLQPAGKAGSSTSTSSTKKKKRYFRGLSYRFDGKPKKKKARRPESRAAKDGSDNYDNAEDLEERASVTSRRTSVDSMVSSIGNSSDTSSVSKSREGGGGQKAKKSFRPALDSESEGQVDAMEYEPSLDTAGPAGGKRRLEEPEEGRQPTAKRPCLERPAPLVVVESLPGAVRSDPKLAVKTTVELNMLDTENMCPFNTCSCERPGLAKIPDNEQERVCEAVEAVGGHRVGCRNIVNSFEQFQVTPRAQPAYFCDLHKLRLSSHCCCPLCGEFCSHGLVYMCRPSADSAPHMFHRACYQAMAKDQRMCPHCGIKKSPLPVQLRMSMAETPLQLLDYTSKMTRTPVVRQDVFRKWDRGMPRQSTVSYQLPSGKTITCQGLLDSFECERLEEILKDFDVKTTSKHATRNMYIPTSAGDNVKLLQLLALNYSPMQKFAEADGGTPLHVAAANNHVLTAHILLMAGAEVNALDNNNETPIMLASTKGHPSMVRYLLSAGADVTHKGDDGMTALHLATQNGNIECTHTILSLNKLPRNFINFKDDGGWTPLVWACEHKHEDIIRYLIEQGADPLITDVEMNIALHWAAFSGEQSVCDLLIASGCDINTTNALGDTPLHISLRQDHYECALFLIARGARLDIKNAQEQSPGACMVNDDPKTRLLIQLGSMLNKMMAENKTLVSRERTVSNDITYSKESVPITAVNSEDWESPPVDYVYVKHNVETTNVPLDRNISRLQHCQCTDNCVNEDTCKCSDLSVRSWYDQNGVLKESFDFNEPPMIFECNDMCRCNVASCNNRVVQHGITSRLQIYKTYGMGWGVKSLVDIPKGSFVCEYVGELISDAEAEQRENDSYLFDLDNRDGETFCIDANKYGNIARFINHSCSPNVIPVKVFVQHQDLRFPNIALFASKDIKRGDVLGFDYGEKFWVIKHKFFTCWCGEEKCRYSKTAIGKTLEAYYRKLEEGSEAADSTPVKPAVKQKNANKSLPETEPKQQQTGNLKIKLKLEGGKGFKIESNSQSLSRELAKQQQELKTSAGQKQGDKQAADKSGGQKGEKEARTARAQEATKADVQKVGAETKRLDVRAGNLLDLEGGEEKVLVSVLKTNQNSKTSVDRPRRSIKKPSEDGKETPPSKAEHTAPAASTETTQTSTRPKRTIRKVADKD